MKTRTTQSRNGILNNSISLIALVLVISLISNECLFAMMNSPLNDKLDQTTSYCEIPDSNGYTNDYLQDEYEEEIELEPWMLSVKAFVAVPNFIHDLTMNVEEEPDMEIEPWMLSAQNFLSDSKDKKEQNIDDLLEEILLVEKETEIELEPWMLSVQAFLINSENNKQSPEQSLEELLLVDEEAEITLEPWMLSSNPFFWNYDLFAEEKANWKEEFMKYAINRK